VCKEFARLFEFRFSVPRKRADCADILGNLQNNLYELSMAARKFWTTPVQNLQYTPQQYIND